MKQTTPFGKYLLLDRVNVGGMAEVFKAKAFGVEGFERVLAIKRILPNMADDDEFINMFVDEARIAVQLSHANVVQIFELGKWENQYYIAMEYVAGRDLRQMLDNYRKRKELMPLPAVAFIGSKICDGLDYAHRKADPSGRPLNVIHRDVSPQNILVGYEGGVKLTDFGIAKAEDRSSKTQAGVLKGKFGYMSPEQVRGMEIDNRSDIFAVGILLYELTTGNRLFVGESDFSTLEKVRNAEVVPPREHNPDLPEELERIVLKALARERDERYTWASDLHDDLQQFLIEDNTIFNAKKLATLMHELYPEEIKEEATKMEKFMRAEAPAGMRQQIDDPGPMAPQPADGLEAGATGEWPASGGGGMSDRREEHTMIFESGFDDLAEAATQIGESYSGASPLPMAAGNSVSRSRAQVSVVASSPGAQQSKSHTGTIIAALLTFVALSGFLVWMMIEPGSTGEIEVSWTPPVKAQVMLDSTVIGTRTPISLDNVALGAHRLTIRAEGYTTRKFRFTLAADEPAVIPLVRLVRIQGRATAKSSTLVVISRPSGAQVLIGGEVKGKTPVNLQRIDPSRPMMLRLKLAGHETLSQTVTFSAQERLAKTKMVELNMRRVGAPALIPSVIPAPGVEPSAVPSVLPSQVAPSLARTGSLSVSSIPVGATAFLSGVEQREKTPLLIENLETSRSHQLELVMRGYRKWTKTVRFTTATSQTVLAQLRKPSSSGGSSSGGKCSGNNGKLTVATLGQGNCRVSVAGSVLGTAPMFAKASPSGRCRIKVTCPSGKAFEKSMNIRSDGSSKLIIQPNMLK